MANKGSRLRSGGGAPLNLCRQGMAIYGEPFFIRYFIRKSAKFWRYSLMIAHRPVGNKGRGWFPAAPEHPRGLTEAPRAKEKRPADQLPAFFLWELPRPRGWRIFRYSMILAFFRTSSGTVTPSSAAFFLLMNTRSSLAVWIGMVAGLALPSRMSAAMWPDWMPSL